MADIVQELTGECFGAIARLRELDGPVPSPETVHSRIRSYIEKLKDRARTHGVPDRDTQDIIYALVALTDRVCDAGDAPPLAPLRIPPHHPYLALTPDDAARAKERVASRVLEWPAATCKRSSPKCRWPK